MLLNKTYTSSFDNRVFDETQTLNLLIGWTKTIIEQYPVSVYLYYNYYKTRP
jgi:hypothetical protein